jgi:S1-C subfamily serine protease
MNCERCGGLTVHASFLGGITAIEGWKYDGRKCLNCGHVTDSLIARNRVTQSQRSGTRESILRTDRKPQTVDEIPSPAEQAGVRTGDIIRKINRKPVKDLRDFERFTSQLTPKSSVLLLLNRGDATSCLSIAGEG